MGVSLTFVSVGDEEKLSKFLDLNPLIPRDRAFVDWSPEFDLYQAAGFGKIGDTKPESVDIKPPDFGLREWWAYLSNVATLAPIRKDVPMTGVPEGVLRLGGTFVLDGDDVAYAHAEELPGTSPEVSDVMRDAGLVAEP